MLLSDFHIFTQRTEEDGMFNRHICICVFLAFVCCSGVTAGQSSRSSVSGTISDTSGAVIGGASAVLTHSDTDISRTTISNEAGIYRFDAVELGIYEIKVTREGFRGFVSRLVRVDANRTTTVNASLEVGPVATNVEVIAATTPSLRRSYSCASSRHATFDSI
jgi:hypothetical protein